MCVSYLIGWEDGVTFWTNCRVKLSETKVILDFFESQLKIAPLTMNNQELSFDGLQLVNIYHGGGGGGGGESEDLTLSR